MTPNYLAYILAKNEYDLAVNAARAEGMGDYDVYVATVDLSDDLHRAYMAYVNG